MTDYQKVQCPYCFEVIEFYVDPQTEGSFVEDCEVCCRPWRVVASRDDDGRLWVDLDRAQ